MPQRFTATENAFEKGIEKTSPKLRTLMDKIGQDTAKAADRAEDPKVAEKVRKLAEAMSA